MKRSRERRTTRRSAATPTPPTGNGNDGDGAGATQQQEGEMHPSTTASAAAKRRVRTRSRTPPPQSSAADKTSHRSKRSRKDNSKVKTETEKGGGRKRQEKGDDSSSDSSDENDEIPISQLAKHATTGTDEIDHAQGHNRTEPQAPSASDSVKVADEAMKDSPSKSIGVKNRETSAMASSDRPRKVKKRDTGEVDKHTLKNTVNEIESEKDESRAQSKADHDVLIKKKAAQPKSKILSKQRDRPPGAPESEYNAVPKGVRNYVGSEKRKGSRLKQEKSGSELDGGDGHVGDAKSLAVRQRHHPVSISAANQRKSSHSRPAGSSKSSNGNGRVKKNSPVPVASKKSKVATCPAKEQKHPRQRKVKLDEKSPPTSKVRHCDKKQETAVLGQKDSGGDSGEQSSDSKRNRILNGSADAGKDNATEGTNEREKKDKRQRVDSQSCEAALDNRTDSETNHSAASRASIPEESTESRARQPAHAIDSEPSVSVDSIKTELYLEGVKVHRGRGSERRFADYWDALNRYISSKSQAKRFCSDGSSGGIEAELKAFLKTKKLRRLHNRVILAIMQQSTEQKVPTTTYKRHLPSHWKRQIRLNDGKLIVPPGGTEASVAKTERAVKSDLRPSSQHEKDKVDIRKLRDEFGRDTDLWTGFGNRKPISTESASAGVHSGRRDCSEETVSEASLPSANLPGALSIDPAVRGIAGRHGMAVSENAVWLLVVAVRAHASAVLRHTVSEMQATERVAMSPLTAKCAETSTQNVKDAKDADSSRGKTEHVVEGGEGRDSGGFAKRAKRSNITVFDVAQALTSNPMLSNGSDNISKSRTAWERCISATNGTLSAASHPQIDVARSDINEHIHVASSKWEKALAARGLKPDSAGGSANASASTSDVAQNAQGGKDLSAIKRTAGSVPSEEEANCKAAENGDTSSPGAVQKGRGTGAKNLAAMRAGAKNLRAMRARRTTSTGAQPDEKDESQPEGATHTDNNQGQGA